MPVLYFFVLYFIFFDFIKKCLSFIFTATGSVDLDYDKPLFQAFETITLTPWQEHDCIAYFQRLRAFKQQPKLSDLQVAKARAISAFIGGNPRLSRLLGDVIGSKDVLSVSATLDGLVDELADYYRRRIDDLTAKAKTLLDALIRGGEPCSQSILAERVGTTQNRIARAFAELQRHQIVIGQRVSGRRETLYRVTDRVFVHFYRTRYGGVKREDSPLLAITDLLKSFFTTDEKRDHAIQFFDKGKFAEGRLLADLAAEEQQGAFGNFYSDGYSADLQQRFMVYLDAVDVLLAKPLEPTVKANILQALTDLAVQPEKTHRAANAALRNELANELAVLWLIVRAWAAVGLQFMQKATADFNQAMSLAGSVPELTCISHRNYGTFLYNVIRDKASAMEAFRIAAEQAEHITLPALKHWVLCDQAFVRLGDKPAQALPLYQRLLTMARADNDKPVEVRVLRDTVFVLNSLGRYQEALDLGEQAFTLAQAMADKRHSVIISGHIVVSLYHLGLYEKAVAQGDQAAELAKAADDKAFQAQALRFTAHSLINLARHDEALTAVRAGLACVEDAALQDGQFTQAWLISVLLILGFKRAIPDCVDQYGQWLNMSQSSADTRSLKLPKPFAFFGVLLMAVTKARQWPALVTLWQQKQQDFEAHIRDKPLDAPGVVICDMIAAGDRAGAYACAADFILTLAAEINHTAEAVLHSTHLEPLIKQSLQTLLSYCENSDFLVDIADLLHRHFTRHFTREITLLRAAAVYHQAGRDPAALARTDPDISTALLRIWQNR